MKMISALIALTMPVTALAQTTTYTYDALGRLVKSVAATGATGVDTNIDYDPAGNRKEYRVTGAPDAGSDTGAGASTPNRGRFIVVPLNGFTIIPIG
jgi:YD repeat-containing protein